MMYNSKLVAAIKVDGKILREFKEVVKLPFGAEYSIYLKNLHSRRALISITIDGKDVLNGSKLVLNAGQEVDFKRSLNENSSTHGNAFKFIERTESIEKNRGIGAEDGIIRIEYQFEQDFSMYVGSTAGWPSKNVSNWPARTPDYFLNTYGTAEIGTTTLASTSLSKGVLRSAARANADSTLVNAVATNATLSATEQSLSFNEAGITVPGKVIEQKFSVADNFPVEFTKHVMVLHLLGEVAGQPVIEPVTVKTKPKCVTCGKTNRATNKCCSECGTSLTVM